VRIERLTAIMPQIDLAGVDHWDGVYQSLSPLEAGWTPPDYSSLVLERALLTEIGLCKPASILEVGCGNSVWLPYLARKTGALVAGLDYSEAGCELARHRLAAEGVEGKVFCADLFRADAGEVGRYDFVYSMGMVEHFTNTVEVLSKLLTLVNPGGVLFTEVPNLKSIHGLMSWVWQPELLAKHKPLGKGDLVGAYKRLGLEGIKGQYAGIFSMGIVAWEIYPRWPRLVPVLLPKILRVRNSIDYRLRRLGRFGGVAPLAPYLYVVGRKPVR
jgi:SAM-dependent methyltransferase